MANHGFVRDKWYQPSDFFPGLPRWIKKRKPVTRKQMQKAAGDIRSLFMPYINKQTGAT